MADLPPQPVYIFRGHKAHITTVRFARRNTRLLTADADGWLVVWSLSTKRPVAVWKAHEQGILGVESWGSDCYLTHGRDQKVYVWSVPTKSEQDFSTALPAEEEIMLHRKQPWLLHALQAGHSGFCPFAVCVDRRSEVSTEFDQQSLVVAVPKSEAMVLIHALPSEKIVHTATAPKSSKLGMMMTMKLASSETAFLLCTGFENGYTCVQRLLFSDARHWQTIYMANTHSQPVLSVDIAPSMEYFLSSSADSVIAKHPISSLNMNQSTDVESSPVKHIQTKHAGQQSVRFRSDGRILATAGWDSRVRIYSAKTLKEVAVLVWHKQGCYTVDFADIEPADNVHEGDSSRNEPSRSLESSVIVALRDRRMEESQSEHWVAVGSKDGKVSLWKIF